MNNIEQMFFNNFNELINNDEFIDGLINVYRDFDLINYIPTEIIPQKNIGIYVVDFYIENNLIIEIDGHDYHKTKAQREKDYNKSRYLQKQNYTVVRFTGTEVYLQPEKCVEDLIVIYAKRNSELEFKEVRGYLKGMDYKNES